MSDAYSRLSDARDHLGDAVRHLFDQLYTLERLSEDGYAALQSANEAIDAADDILYTLVTQTHPTRPWPPLRALMSEAF